MYLLLCKTQLKLKLKLKKVHLLFQRLEYNEIILRIFDNEIKYFKITNFVIYYSSSYENINKHT